MFLQTLIIFIKKVCKQVVSIFEIRVGGFEDSYDVSVNVVGGVVEARFCYIRWGRRDNIKFCNGVFRDGSDVCGERHGEEHGLVELINCSGIDRRPEACLMMGCVLLWNW